MYKRNEFKNQDIFLEFVTLYKMIRLYCESQHAPFPRRLCSECIELLKYARQRLSNCPYYQKKIACNNCRIHCYREPFKSQIKRVMRFSGPKLLFHAPTLAIRHLFCQLRKPDK
ncbi:MAG: nitrous oxide-stimulated promoter family protein [Candidatus Rifleibacteriota bacterium]